MPGLMVNGAPSLLIIFCAWLTVQCCQICRYKKPEIMERQYASEGFWDGTTADRVGLQLGTAPGLLAFNGPALNNSSYLCQAV